MDFYLYMGLEVGGCSLFADPSGYVGRIVISKDDEVGCRYGTFSWASELVGCYRPLIVGCSCRQASLATGVSKDGRHLQGELQYGMLPSPQDWPELYSWWDESTSRAHEWDGECIPSTGTGAGKYASGTPWMMSCSRYNPGPLVGSERSLGWSKPIA